jgi:hypothetical protein
MERKQKIEIGVVVTIALALISFAFWLGRLDSKISDHETQIKKSTTDAISEIRKAAAIANPASALGQVVFWYRFEATQPLPNGYDVCDGRLVLDRVSPFHGKKLPNLMDAFLIGVPENRIGEVGGKTTVDLTATAGWINTPRRWVRLTGGEGAVEVPHQFGVNVSVFSDGRQGKHDNRPNYVGLLPIIRIR